MTPKEAERALKEYARAYAEQRDPDFAKADVVVWTKVADSLVERGELELAGFAVRRLHRKWPDLPWARNVALLFELAPEPDPSAPPFADRFPTPVQIAARPGAETALLVFCGAEHRIGMPLPMLHRWLSRWPVSLIYLRDLKMLGYLAGIETLGSDLPATIAALRREIDALNARRIVCYGHSIGGFGAMRYAVDLEADVVVSMAGVINMRPAFNTGLHYASTANKLNAVFPGEVLDLRELRQRSASPPRTFMVYGEHNWDDRIHGEHMGGLEGVELVPVEGCKSHNVAVELMRNGKFDALMQRALLSGPAA